MPRSGDLQESEIKVHGSIKLIIAQTLKEGPLKRYEIKMESMNIPAGSSDTLKHRHDAYVIGFVLEGNKSDKTG